RECLDHVVVLGECHLRHLLLSYMTYYNGARIYPWRRMRRSRAPSNGLGRFFAAQFSAGCTTNMSGFDCRQAHRDARTLAQSRLSLLLALEVAPTGRATADRHGAARIDPADERRKSALGRAAHPRRTAQARRSEEHT